MFKSKHKLDLGLVSMDQRGKLLLGYSDAELANMGGYDLVHYDDLAYVASAHQECKGIASSPFLPKSQGFHRNDRSPRETRTPYLHVYLLNYQQSQHWESIPVPLLEKVRAISASTYHLQ